MEYIVISSQAKEFIGKINEYIKQGWKPLGGVSVVYIPAVNNSEDPQGIMTQAMIREKIKPESEKESEISAE